jgi:quinoprotein glucose dehydrogenase
MRTTERIGAVAGALALSALGALGGSPALAAADGGWAYYGGDPGGSRYSTIDQVNRDNVGQLELAWQFRTGAVKDNPDLKPMIDFQATPILLPPAAGGHLVVCDPFNKIFALDPEKGTERWSWDPQIDKTPYAGRFKCKGVAFWQDSQAAPDAACAFRLYMPTADKRLFAIDARDGKPCAGFGQGGVVDFEPLLAALAPAEGTQGTQLLAPAAVVRDVVVVSTTSNKFRSAKSVNGAIRGFDARTGALRWTWDPLVREAQEGIEPTPADVGGGNNWTPMSVDNERDLVFIPTASPAPNFWGAHRPGDNKWANSIVALRGSTGELVWGFQTLHHDVWDRDVGSPPIAVDMVKDGRTIPAVFQLVKTGMLFSFNRETGEPLFPIEERAVPTNTDIVGEQLSPTQPFPVKPPVLVRNTITPEDAWGFTAWEREACRRKIASMRHGNHYEPMSTQGTIMFPQVGGGSNWGGGAFDPRTNMLVTPVSEIPYYVKLVPKEQVDPEFAKRPEAGAPMQKPGYIGGTPYGVQQGPLSPRDFPPTPCTAPPWNWLVGVDMAAGEIRWKVPFGVLDRMSPVPIPLKFGTPSAGGPIVTAGGLTFIGATSDARVRAFDTATGEQIWEHRIPTSAQATPMTYLLNGRQYIVFAAGGHSWYYNFGIDDYLLAFALPEKQVR